MATEQEAAGGDARFWDEERYRKSILQERELRCQTVFRTAFAPSQNPNPEILVVASSDGSLSSYSLASCIASMSQYQQLDMAKNQRTVADPLSADPLSIIQAHKGPTYDLKFYSHGENSLLFSCGDDGRLRGWNWKEILSSHIVVDKKTKGVLGGLYRQYLRLMPSQSMNRKPQFIQLLAMLVHTHGTLKQGNRKWYSRVMPIICIALLLVNLVIRLSQVQKMEQHEYGACGTGTGLSVWSLLSYECIFSIGRYAPVQDLLFDDNQIVAVGSEPVLTRFSINGATLSQLKCAPQSAFSVSLHPSGVIAVSGYGALVDVLSQFGSHLCTFYCLGLDNYS